MTASERLRELDGAMTKEWWRTPDSAHVYCTDPDDGEYGMDVADFEENKEAASVVALRNALPLIADYVNATEAYFAAHDRGEQGHRAHIREKYEKLTEALGG